MPLPEPNLSNSTLFANLKPEALQTVRAAASFRRVEKDGFFFYQGDPADTIYVLVEGRVKVTQVTTEGQQVIMHMIGPETSFGVLAVVEGNVYPVSAQAVEDSTALVWSRETMRDLMTRFPQISLNSMEVLSGHAQDFQNRLREMVTERVERRVARAVLRLAQQMGKMTDEGVLINMSLSRQDLAEMTGTTLYSVSRILSQWEEQGLVSIGRERIVVKFPHGLVKIAEDLPGPPTGE